MKGGREREGGEKGGRMKERMISIWMKIRVISFFNLIYFTEISFYVSLNARLDIIKRKGEKKKRRRSKKKNRDEK